MGTFSLQARLRDVAAGRDVDSDGHVYFSAPAAQFVDMRALPALCFCNRHVHILQQDNTSVSSIILESMSPSAGT